jgi:Flp pilus assembly protein CpaB
MKRRNWLWFIASFVLALLAGIVVFVTLSGVDGGGPPPPPPTRRVVVASQSIASKSEIRADFIRVEELDENEIPSGAAVRAQDVIGGIAKRDFAQGEVITMQDIVQPWDPRRITETLLIDDDKLVVVLEADDILSQWGGVIPGDHVDVLFSLDIILETPMYPQEVLAAEQGIQLIERDQNMDNTSVLALQNLEVLEILVEPQSPAQAQAQQEEGLPPELPRRALVLQIDPQDAVILKYLRDSEAATIDVALRARDNDTLYQVDAVNVNYLILRYGIVLPEPLE